MSIDPNNSKEKEFENWLVAQGMTQPKQWKRIVAGLVKPAYQVTLPTYVRNTIHHPENRENDIYTYAELTDSINEMRVFIQNGYHV